AHRPQPDRPDPAAGHPRPAAGRTLRQPGGGVGRRAGCAGTGAGGVRVSPVWTAARAAVRRRRLQTAVIGVVVLAATATIVMATGLLVATSAPFDRAFDRQQGAHLVAVFDPAVVSPEELAATGGSPAVAATAGPFDQVAIEIADAGDLP